jgi:outer membrane receptor protein involved in Fe transport
MPLHTPYALAAARLLGAAVLASTVSLHAQSVRPPSVADEPAKPEVVELSPFVLAEDRNGGWSANDTLSATRTKQALKDVPVNIDAITADFIEDLGLYTADETAQFIANVYAAPTMENDNQQGNFAFRGLSQANNVSRNYFRWYIPSDTYNVERIDFGKGSNSLIFGEVEPGGQGAVFTKRAQFRNFGTLTAVANSLGAHRFLFDYNRKLTDKVAYRFNAITREERTYQDASRYGLRGATIAVTWQPFPNTTIRIENERGDFENARGFGGVFIREQSARSRGFNTAGTYYTSDGVWIQQATLPSADRSSANAPAGGQPSLLEGEFFDVQMRNAAGAVVGTKRLNGFSKEYNLRGSFDRQARPFDTYSVTIEQRVGPVSLELAFNHQNQMALRTDNFFSQTISVDVNGRPYIDSTLDLKRFGSETDAFRGAAAYRWKPARWMEQLFVAGAEYREDAIDNLRWQYFNIQPFQRGLATSVNTNNDRGRLRIYLDDPQFYSRSLFDRMKPERLPVTETVNMIPLRYFPAGTSAASGTEWRQSYSTSLSASGRYFGGRIQTLLGARRDWNRAYEYVGTRTEGPFKEEIAPPKRRDALPGEYVENLFMRQANTSYTAGLTYTLTRDINLYAIYSESFRFQDARTFDRERFGPITGVTQEVGLKGSLLDDRASVTLGVFSIDRQNVVLSWNNVIDFSASETEDLMNPNDVLPGSPGYKYVEPGTASASRNYKSTEQSTGADLTVMLRPTRGLQVRLGFGHTEVLGEPDLKSFRAYYDAAVKRGNESPAMLADAKFLLDSLDNSNKPTGARAAPWSANWVVDYGFARDSLPALRGVRVGVNGVWRDNYLFGIANGQELSGGTSHLVNAYVMRDQRLWDQQIRLRVGVRNLVDLENSGIRKTSFTTLADGRNVYRYSYVMPLTWEFTGTVRF